jgi:hypothetical protein
MISFIVPAHNEQACLGRTLQAIHESALAVNQFAPAAWAKAKAQQTTSVSSVA